MSEQFPDNAPSAYTPKQKKIIAALIGVILISGFVGMQMLTGKKPKKVDVTTETKAKVKPEDFEQAVQPQNVKDPNEPTQNKDVNPLTKVLDRPEGPGPTANNQAEMEAYDKEMNRKDGPREHNNFQHENIMQASAPVGFQLPKGIEDRLTDGYQRMVSHFKQKEPKTWQLEASAYKSMTVGNATAEVDPTLQHLVEGGIRSGGIAYNVPSGTRILAITDSKVSTDHPGYFSATVIRPFLLKGAKLICQSGANTNDRIPAQPVKLVFRDSLEIALQGQVQTDFPGVDGDVTTHYMKRLGPAITNAAIGGAFAAWALSRGNSGTNIDTRDAIVAPIVQSSVEGVQNEITRMGGDFPNTVEIPAGKQFQIMLTEAINFRK